MRNRLFLFQRLSQLNESEIAVKLQSCYKFMAVKNPFARVIDVFSENLQRSYDGSPYSAYALDISYYDSRNSSIFSRLRYTLTYIFYAYVELCFEQFVRYLIQKNKEHALISSWGRYGDYCSPCAMDYNTVFKMETAIQDGPYVMSRMGLNQQLGWVFNWTQYQNALRTVIAKEYYTSLNNQLVTALTNVYGEDLEMFNYERHPYFIINAGTFGFESPGSP